MGDAKKKVSLKLLIDKKQNKVLFAEAGKDFVDFLFNLLSLPVGTVIKLINNAAMVGCIGNLYQSIDNLSEDYLQPNQKKDSLLNPHVTSNATNNMPLLLAASKQEPSPGQRNIYTCSNKCGCISYSNYTTCPACRYSMNKQLTLIGVDNSMVVTTSKGGYVKELVTYMVTDDLSVSPLSMVSGVAVLNKFNVKDFGVLEEKVVQFGIDEGLELLKASLHSKAALTNVFLVKQGVKVSATSS